MSWLDTWDGYLPPTSNTTYTPNQFFDVVLPWSSRGVVRLVAYMIRKTLGWADARGRPHEPHVLISYREIERRAGIARSMLRQALDEALAARFIECLQEGRPDAAARRSESALYRLRWDPREEYVTDPQDFQGFFAGNGNLTYIPNQFFDVTIPNEPLAVVKVVGAVIRQTIGWQTRYGFRRQEVALSFSELQRQTRIVSRRSLNEALRTALEHSHIVRVRGGVFDAYAERQEAATYAIKWSDCFGGQAAEGERLEKDTSEAARKGYQY